MAKSRCECIHSQSEVSLVSRHSSGSLDGVLLVGLGTKRASSLGTMEMWIAEEIASEVIQHLSP